MYFITQNSKLRKAKFSHFEGMRGPENQIFPTSVILRHPPFCPMLHLSQELKVKVKNQSHIGVSVAVAVILGSDFLF